MKMLWPKDTCNILPGNSHLQSKNATLPQEETFNLFGTILCNTIWYPFMHLSSFSQVFFQFAGIGYLLHEYLAPGFVGELLDTILCNTEFTFHRNICQIFKHKVPIYHVTYGAGFSSALIFLFTHCLQ